MRRVRYNELVVIFGGKLWYAVVKEMGGHCNDCFGITEKGPQLPGL